MTIVKLNLLNRYILRKFLTPFLASFAALCVLLLVSQIFDRLDRFLSSGVGWKHVVGYLLSSMPLQAVQVLPVACLLGTLFVVGTLARTREYIAGLAGGLPPEKFLGGIFLAGFLISLVSLAANETFVPMATRYSQRVYQQKIKKIGDWTDPVKRNLVIPGAEGRVWTTTALNLQESFMSRVIVDTYAHGRLDQQIDAQGAVWNPPSAWTFQKGVIRTFDPGSLAVDKFEAFDQRQFAFSEKPDDLVTPQDPDSDEMNYKQLKRHLRRLEALGVPARKLEVELMMKTALPFTCFVVTFLGVPLAMSGKGSRAMGIAAGGALTLIYLGFIQFGKALGQHIIPPLAGAWMGNVVFMAVAIGLWWRMRRSA
jgi:lipopolysaccharide export system permease protein